MLESFGMGTKEDLQSAFIVNTISISLQGICASVLLSVKYRGARLGVRGGGGGGAGCTGGGVRLGVRGGC